MMGDRFQSLESPHDCDYPAKYPFSSQNLFTDDTDQVSNNESPICKLLLN